MHCSSRIISTFSLLISQDLSWAPLTIIFLHFHGSHLSNPIYPSNNFSVTVLCIEDSTWTNLDSNACNICKEIISASFCLHVMGMYHKCPTDNEMLMISVIGYDFGLPQQWESCITWYFIDPHYFYILKLNLSLGYLGHPMCCLHWCSERHNEEVELERLWVSLLSSFCFP